MKKLLVLLGILAAFSFVACNKEADPVNPPASDPIENPTDTPDTPDVPDTPAEPEAPAADLVIYEKAETFTTKGYETALTLGSTYSLNDYKYIKVELEVVDAKGCKIAIQPVNSGYKKCGLIEVYASGEGTYYTDCGTNYFEDTDYDGTGDVQCEITELSIVQIYAQDPAAGYSTADGIEVKINKITLTNTK